LDEDPDRHDQKKNASIAHNQSPRFTLPLPSRMRHPRPASTLPDM
jgi:hypothetical protein